MPRRICGEDSRCECANACCRDCIGSKETQQVTWYCGRPDCGDGPPNGRPRTAGPQGSRCEYGTFQKRQGGTVSVGDSFTVAGTHMCQVRGLYREEYAHGVGPALAQVAFYDKVDDGWTLNLSSLTVWPVDQLQRP